MSALKSPNFFYLVHWASRYLNLNLPTVHCSGEARAAVYDWASRYLNLNLPTVHCSGEARAAVYDWASRYLNLNLPTVHYAGEARAAVYDWASRYLNLNLPTVHYAGEARAAVYDWASRYLNLNLPTVRCSGVARAAVYDWASRYWNLNLPTVHCSGEARAAVYDLRGLPLQAGDLLPDGRVRHAAAAGPGRDGDGPGRHDRARREHLVPSAGGARRGVQRGGRQAAEHRQARDHRLRLLHNQVQPRTCFKYRRVCLVWGRVMFSRMSCQKVKKGSGCGYIYIS